MESDEAKKERPASPPTPPKPTPSTQNKPPQTNAAPSAKLTREQQIAHILQSTKAGKDAWDKSHPRIIFDTTTGEYYYLPGQIHLNPNLPLPKQVEMAAHELGHVKQEATHENRSILSRQKRQDYVRSGIEQEVQADQTRHEIYKELQNKALMNMPKGQAEWNTQKRQQSRNRSSETATSGRKHPRKPAPRRTLTYNTTAESGTTTIKGCAVSVDN